MRNDAMRRLTSCLVATAALAVGAATAEAIDITECGQIVPRGQIGTLVGDLDCTDPNSLSVDGTGVYLEKRSTLELGGFSLIGPIASGDGVFCDSKCKVNGPGSIMGFSKGILAAGRLIRVTDVTIDGASDTGMRVLDLVARRCTVTGTGEWGIRGERVLIFDSDISGNAKHGIIAGKLRLVDVIVNGNGAGGVHVHSSGRKPRLAAVDSVFTGNSFDCPPDAHFCQDLDGSTKNLRRTLVGDTCFKGCPQN